MKQFNELNDSALIDLLATQTSFYTQMLSDNIKTDQFYKCKRMIEQLTREIALRMKDNSRDNPAITPPLSLPHD
jgi:hypothetical protein